MLNQFSRTQLLLGPEALETLAHAHVIVFGIGGAGGNAAEALARAGVGALDLVDDDTVGVTNINRQAVATLRAVGHPKVEAMAERIADINPECEVTCHRCFYLPATADRFDLSEYDYVLDCVDTVTAKLYLVQQAQAAGTRVISAMGAANKLDPTQFKVADIYDTSICPLARIIRKECHKRHIPGFKTVYSTEPAMQPRGTLTEEAAADSVPQVEVERPPAGRRSIPGSVSWVPPVAGLIMAGEVVKDLVGIH